jgi:hypothetical protein
MCGAPVKRKTTERRHELDTEAAIIGATEYLEERAPDAVAGQNGNATTFKVACWLKDIGISELTALELMQDHYNAAKCFPEWSTEELETLVSNAYAYGTNAPGVRTFEAEFDGIAVPEPNCKPGATAEPPEPDSVKAGMRWARSGDEYDADEFPWLIDGKLPAAGVGFLYGPSQSGKTFVAYTLAGCLANGAPFFGEKPEERVSTFILQSESFPSGRKRLRALDIAHEVGAGADPLPVHVADAGGIGTPKEQTAIMRALEAKAGELCAAGQPRLGLIVLDTLSASRLLSEENSNDDTAGAVCFLQQVSDKFQCFVLALHHPPKSGHGLRGGGALLANADVAIEIQREGEAEVRKVVCVKQRDGEQGSWGYFTLLPTEIGRRKNGKLVTSCIVSMATGSPPAGSEALKTSEQAAMDILSDLVADGERTGATNDLGLWRRFCADDDRICDSKSKGSRQAAARRTTNALINRGLVTTSGAGVDAHVRPAWVAPIE